MKTSAKEKLFYALVAPIIVGVAVFLVQRFVESRKPILTVTSESDVYSITNNTEDVLRVRVTYVFETPGGGEEHCTSPDIRGDWLVGAPRTELQPTATKRFPMAADCPTTPGAQLRTFGVRAWNHADETVYHDDHWSK